MSDVIALYGVMLFCDGIGDAGVVVGYETVYCQYYGLCWRLW